VLNERSTLSRRPEPRDRNSNLFLASRIVERSGRSEAKTGILERELEDNTNSVSFSKTKREENLSKEAGKKGKKIIWLTWAIAATATS